MYLGIDIGSAASKVIIIDDDLIEISSYIKNVGIGGGGAKAIVDKALKEAGIVYEDIKYTVVTGYGRVTYTEANKQIAELSCHAKGISQTIPGIKTVIDVGGQDAKVMRLDQNGNIQNFVMNDKCAAGTGRFLEVMARVLGCDVAALSDIAKKSDKQVDISSTCAVFAESEVISRLASGENRENVARGVHASIARRIAGLAKRVGIEPEVAMTGGVAKSEDVVSELEKVLGKKVNIPENPQIMGAYGAAIYAREFYLKEKGN